MNKDLQSNSSIVNSIACASIDADADGASADLKGYSGALVIADVGVGGITFTTTNMIEFEVEESDDDSTFTDVADADLVGYVAGTNDGTFGRAISAATDDAKFKAQYIGNKRYIRVVANFSGTHGTASPVSASILRINPTYGPV